VRIALVSHTNAPWTPIWAERLAARGHALRVFSFHPESLDGVDVRFVGTGEFDKYRGKSRYLTRVPAVRRELRSFAPDVVHAPYITSNGLVAALAGSGPLVVSAVGGDVLKHSDHRLWRAPLQPLVVRFVCARAHAVHAVSTNLERALRAAGVAADRIVRFPVGVDLRRFRPVEDAARPAPGTLVCTRNHAPVYGIADLLEALARLSGDWRGTLAGGGHLLEEHRALADRLGLGARVAFTGPLAHAQIPDLLRAAAVYVSPAHSDGASASLLEAMACGLLPVVARIDANEEWVEDGRNGLLFAPGDPADLARALERAIGDAALRERARRENPERVAAEGELERNVARLEALLEAARAR
jgi:glycosyltransferase involved in cell wall biosynthesis